MCIKSVQSKQHIVNTQKWQLWSSMTRVMAVMIVLITATAYYLLPSWRVPCSFACINSFNPVTVWGRCYFYLHFIDTKTEAQRSYICNIDYVTAAYRIFESKQLKTHDNINHNKYHIIQVDVSYFVSVLLIVEFFWMFLLFNTG